MLTDKKVKEILDYYGVEGSNDRESMIIIDNQEKVLGKELIQDIFINSGLVDDINYNVPEKAITFNVQINGGSQHQSQYRKTSENKYYYLAA